MSALRRHGHDLRIPVISKTPANSEGEASYAYRVVGMHIDIQPASCGLHDSPKGVDCGLEVTALDPMDGASRHSGGLREGAQRHLSVRPGFAHNVCRVHVVSIYAYT
jgi:hypothetical protein